MKIDSAFNKLRKYNYNVSFTNIKDLYASKGSKEIFIQSTEDPDGQLYVRTVQYSINGARKIQENNLSKVLRILGDMSPPNLKSKKMLQNNIVKNFIEKGSSSITSEMLLSLNVRCIEDLTSIAREVFSNVFDLRKKLSYARGMKQKRINSKIQDLWREVVDAYLKENIDSVPIRKVKITTSVENFPDLKNQWGSYVDKEVVAMSPVFARSAEEASTLVRSLLGDFAKAQDMGVFVLGDKETSIDIYNKNHSSSSKQNYINDAKSVQKEIESLEARIKASKMHLEICEQKIKLAEFLENFATVATMTSQGAEITGSEFD